MLSCNIPVIISNLLVTGIGNYSIYRAKLFQKIRHDYMITSSKHNKIMNPKPEEKILMQKYVQRLWVYDPTQRNTECQTCGWTMLQEVHSVSQKEHSGFSILFYTILHKFSKFIHTIHMCNNYNLTIKIQAKGN